MVKGFLVLQGVLFFCPVFASFQWILKIPSLHFLGPVSLTPQLKICLLWLPFEHEGTREGAWRNFCTSVIQFWLWIPCRGPSVPPWATVWGSGIWKPPQAQPGKVSYVSSMWGVSVLSR